MSGFRKFLLRGNVVDLAVAVVVGGAFGNVVQALVRDLITPLIGAFGGVPDFSAIYFSINTSRFQIGDLIGAVISFLLIGAVVYYFVVVPINALVARFTPATPAPMPTHECPECLSKIPRAARRCAFCTAELYERSDDVAPRQPYPQR